MFENVCLSMDNTAAVSLANTHILWQAVQKQFVCLEIFWVDWKVKFARSSSVLDAKVPQLYLHLHHERITGMRRKKGHERAVGCHYFNCFLITEQVSPLEATPTYSTQKIGLTEQ